MKKFTDNEEGPINKSEDETLKRIPIPEAQKRLSTENMKPQNVDVSATRSQEENSSSSHFQSKPHLKTLNNNSRDEYPAACTPQAEDWLGVGRQDVVYTNQRPSEINSQQEGPSSRVAAPNPTYPNPDPTDPTVQSSRCLHPRWHPISPLPEEQKEAECLDRDPIGTTPNDSHTTTARRRCASSSQTVEPGRTSTAASQPQTTTKFEDESGGGGVSYNARCDPRSTGPKHERDNLTPEDLQQRSRFSNRTRFTPPPLFRRCWRWSNEHIPFFPYLLAIIVASVAVILIIFAFSPGATNISGLPREAQEEVDVPRDLPYTTSRHAHGPTPCFVLPASTTTATTTAAAEEEEQEEEDQETTSGVGGKGSARYNSEGELFVSGSPSVHQSLLRRGSDALQILEGVADPESESFYLFENLWQTFASPAGAAARGSDSWNGERHGVPAKAALVLLLCFSPEQCAATTARLSRNAAHAAATKESSSCVVRFGMGLSSAAAAKAGPIGLKFGGNPGSEDNNKGFVGKRSSHAANPGDDFRSDFLIHPDNRGKDVPIDVHAGYIHADGVYADDAHADDAHTDDVHADDVHANGVHAGVRPPSPPPPHGMHHRVVEALKAHSNPLFYLDDAGSLDVDALTLLVHVTSDGGGLMGPNGVLVSSTPAIFFAVHHVVASPPAQVNAKGKASERVEDESSSLQEKMRSMDYERLEKAGKESLIRALANQKARRRSATSAVAAPAARRQSSAVIADKHGSGIQNQEKGKAFLSERRLVEANVDTVGPLLSEASMEAEESAARFKEILLEPLRRRVDVVIATI